MKIYLDTSALNRIFDDQSQGRIYLESVSMELIFLLIENHRLEMVSSEAIQAETDRNPYDERRLFIEEVLGKATEFQPLDEFRLKHVQPPQPGRDLPVPNTDDTNHVPSINPLRTKYPGQDGSFGAGIGIGSAIGSRASEGRCDDYCPALLPGFNFEVNLGTEEKINEAIEQQLS